MASTTCGKIYEKGEIVWWKPENDKFGHVQAGERPVLVISEDENSPVVTVLPMTTKVKDGSIKQFPVIVHGSVAIVLIDQVTTIDKREIANRKGRISEEQVCGIENSLCKHLFGKSLNETV